MKKKYTVEVSETLSRQIDVEAYDSFEAYEIVSEQYHNEEIVLDESDFNNIPTFKIIDPSGE